MIDEKVLIKKLKKNSIFDKITNSEGKNIYEIIECLPKIDQWISVEERLPSNDEVVLVKCNEYEIYEWGKSYDCTSYKIAHYSWYTEEWYDADRLLEETGCDGFGYFVKVLAWMPTPK